MTQSWQPCETHQQLHHQYCWIIIEVPFLNINLQSINFFFFGFFFDLVYALTIHCVFIFVN